MRIGIITHYFNHKNYGGLLQAYALTKYLNNQGYQAEQIPYDFVNSEKSIKFVPKNYIKKILRIKNIKKAINSKLAQRRTKQITLDFTKRKELFTKFELEIPHIAGKYYNENIEMINSFEE